MAEDHAETKEHLGLSRVALLRNPTYHPSGTKIYVSLMARHGFKPTKPGPYCYRNRMHQRGLANVPGAAGGRVRMERGLMKGEGAGGGSVKQITPDDQCSDAVYLCEVEVGTPAQKLKLEFNTSSSELWVCAPSQNLGSDSPGSFGAERSTSYRSMNSSWMAKGGDGSSASGGTGVGQVSIGGLRVKEQVIQLAMHIEGHPAPRGADGCLGLSIPQTKTITENGVPDPQDTLITNLMSRSELPKDAQLFTAVFDRSGDKEDEAFCTFGHIDQETLKAAEEAGGYIMG
ncbi:aspartic endopeptidase [Gaeumannomyces tritici R3-111a-1]|uniref:Aspartic endopeptidase n=1 Tax=Gaeumannomyces tritici (strain R3-111a-1) TaxID=644352 RepID=J3NHF9_GAET3|nr:aspartic endopeptidase [Gaeumannomyces tritici R3-111a-1]EJT80702.1 aspartic endopeptidase [Gaeumannomyces tritici R3-111a-1]